MHLGWAEQIWSWNCESSIESRANAWCVGIIVTTAWFSLCGTVCQHQLKAAARQWCNATAWGERTVPSCTLNDTVCGRMRTPNSRRNWKNSRTCERCQKQLVRLSRICSSSTMNLRPRFYVRDQNLRCSNNCLRSCKLIIIMISTHGAKHQDH